MNLSKKHVDVHAVLLAYLTYHAQKNAEPWMYEALALAIEMNRGSQQDVKTALKYAADLAERSHNPNHLVSVADMLLLHGDYDRVGNLLDEAAEKVPHRAEPLLMMVLLAQKTKDPNRMADAVDRLLALGWPQDDERIRSEARTQVEQLAKTLREEGRDGEAETFLKRLAESESRDLFVRLTWLGDAGLALEVDEPPGVATAKFQTPRTISGGAIVKEGYGAHAESVYVCPRAFDGDYTIRIDTVYNNEKNPALEATLEIITHEGTPQEHKETRTISLSKPPAPVVVHLTGGRRKDVLPFVMPRVNLVRTAPAAGGRTPRATQPSGAQPAPGAAPSDAHPRTGAAQDPLKGRPR